MQVSELPSENSLIDVLANKLTHLTDRIDDIPLQILEQFKKIATNNSEVSLSKTPHLVY